jgi:hypothetical protein
VTDQQLQGMVWQLQRKVDELKDKLEKVERIVRNIDGNTAQTANMVRDILRRK